MVTLVARIARTPSGRAILEGIRDSGGIVKIEKPALTDPPNATVGRQTSVQTQAPGTSGAKPDWYIGFDPQDWPSPIDPDARSPEVVLFVLLSEALACLRAGSAAEAQRVISDLHAVDTAAIARFQEERNTR